MINFLRTIAETIDTNEVNIPKVEAQNLLPELLNTVYWIAGVAAVIVIVIAGIFHMFSFKIFLVQSLRLHTLVVPQQHR